MERILVVDDEPSMTQFLAIMLRKEGYQVITASNGPEALQALRSEEFGCVLTDVKMPGMDGLELLDAIKEIDSALPVVVMTAYASEKTAADAMKKGAFQYLEKHARNDEIKLVLRNALNMKQVQSENIFLKRQLKKTHSKKEIIGSSEEMSKVFKLIDKVAETDSTILICGESGTGKELIAREIHYRSKRANGPFVSINCGALPKDLLESNLFGHQKGSFTGAIKDQMGLMQVAEGGTFFLDEVGEMDPDTQVKLLRALQEREIIPVGGQRPIKINVRLVAATNADLERDVQEGRFRSDLFYRLNVIPLKLPPLRIRRDDIPILVDHFLRKFAAGNTPKAISKEALQCLHRHDWPGNVRELENAIERAVILHEGEIIEIADLPERVVEGNSRKGNLVIDNPEMTLEELEKAYILKVLTHTGWQKKKTARILGINVSTLYRKLIAYRMDQQAPGGLGIGMEDGGELDEAA